MMNTKYITLLLSVTLIIGCSGNHEGNSADTIVKKDIEQASLKTEPTQYKVLDLEMGMDKESLIKKGFDCSSLEYTGSCEIYTHPEAPKNSYKPINNNGTINGIQSYLDKNSQIYKIVLTSRHTHNDNDIEQFKQTLLQLVDHNPSIDETLDVMNSGYFQGAHFVSLSFTDKARLSAYTAQKENTATKAASDIKNFGK
ncbi:MAG TPA: hypothetical protein PLM93_11890 [Sulfuricurvum sp.]|nr:MAG: hypothetical protein B7Y30_11600 [Campylobacterales bacterium 16-40-21]OZA02039.1 MAG: hypothetical protein B7X89_10980 [Sulfuricurvum sp. 17-40-25]HQS67877.1 hypothetical protein [Sulfuricurvum sp.]HQT37277.1 hypothetical protein [Sulfuricurvum sp.]